VKGQTIDSYLEALASSASTPGGGSVAAITAAQAAALISMVCSLTKSSEVVRASLITDIHQRSESARHRFMELCELDIEGFSKVMAAYKLPKGDQKEKELQAALHSAAQPPLETLELASSLTNDIEKLAEIGNQNLRTDTGIAALLITSSIRSAEMNVKINLQSINDKAFSDDAIQKIKVALETSRVLEKVAMNIDESLSDQG